MSATGTPISSSANGGMCPGRRIDVRGSLLGICIACARQQDGAKAKPEAEHTHAAWRCVNREPLRSEVVRA